MHASLIALPSETLTTITDGLRDDTPALLNLALTNSILLPFARSALYETVRLQERDDSQDEYPAHTSFGNAIAEYPAFGPFVRDLEVRLREAACDSLPSSLHSVLSQGAFTRLKSLALFDVDFDWAEELFATVQTNGALHTLVLDHTSIQSANSEIIASHEGDTDGGVVDLDMRCGTLDTLAVRWPAYLWAEEDGAIERIFAKKLNLGRLQTLELAFEWPEQYEAWMPAIRAASSSLVTLRITSGMLDEFDFPFEDEAKLLLETLSNRCPSLRSLHLAYFSTGNDLRTHFLQTVCSALDSDPPPFPNLTELAIDLVDRPDPATVDYFRNTLEEDEPFKWKSVTPELASRLADVLFSPARPSEDGRYPHLHRVRVGIRRQVSRTDRNRCLVLDTAQTQGKVIRWASWPFQTLDRARAARSRGCFCLVRLREGAREIAQVLAAWKDEIWARFAREAARGGVEFEIDMLWDDPYV